MVNSYVLVNPYIDGSFKSKVKARNSQEAAKMLYTGLSEHFNNSVPAFHFTVQKGTSSKGKMYHFKVSEQREDDTVNFSIKPLTLKNEDAINNEFKGRLDEFKNKLNQDGGKHKSKRHSKHHDSSDSSDSDSDSSSDYYRQARQNSYVPSYPFNHWWYDPFVYRLDSVYMPTFYSYSTPLYYELVSQPFSATFTLNSKV
jgi:hypothetical protein